MALCHSYAIHISALNGVTCDKDSDSDHSGSRLLAARRPQKTIETFRYVWRGTCSVARRKLLVRVRFPALSVKTRYHNIGNSQWDGGRFEERVGAQR